MILLAVVVIENAKGKKKLDCNFVFGCTGYNYDQGATNPIFQNKEVFKGEFVNPQFWPEN